MTARSVVKGFRVVEELPLGKGESEHRYAKLGRVYHVKGAAEQLVALLRGQGRVAYIEQVRGIDQAGEM